MAKPVTDPAILAQLNAPGPATKPVTDPAVLAQLNGETPEASPRWDVFGDIGRAAKESARALVDDFSAAFPSVEERQAKEAENRQNYGIIGGVAKSAIVDPAVRLGHALRMPLDAAGVVAAPVTGLARATVGSALSYLPPPQPGVDMKAMADEAVDTSLMGLGPRGLGRVGGPRVAAAEAEALSADRRSVSTRNKAAAKVAARAKQDGLTAQEVLDAQQAARATGDQITIMDLGKKNVRGLAGAVHRAPGEAGGKLDTFLDARDAAAADAMIADVQANIGKGSTYNAQQSLLRARSAAARPAYDAATSVGQVWSPRLQQFFTHSEVQTGLKQGLKFERQEATAEGREFIPQEYGITGFDEAGDPIISGTPPMKALAVAKEGLDAQVAALRDPVTGRPTKAGVALGKLRDAFVGELDALNPKYKAARESWSGPTQSMEAMRDGRDHFSRRESNAQIQAEFDALPPGDKEFYRLGAAEAKIDAIESAQDAADKSKRVINSIKDRKRFRMLFDSDAAADKFMASVERKRRMFDTKSDIKGNSKTAGRLAEDEAAAVENVREGLGAGRDLLTGNWFGLVDRALRMKELGLRNNPELNSEIVNFLTNPDFAVGDKGNPFVTLPMPKGDNYFAKTGAASNAIAAGRNSASSRSENRPRK